MVKKFKSSVFISYSSKDREFAEKLANDLKSRQVNIWFAKWEIKVGDSIIERLESGIENSDYLIVVLSRNSVNSKWVKEELRAALMGQVSGQKIRVLPLLYQDCTIPVFLREKKFADFRSSYEEGITELLKAINPDSSNEYNDSFDLTNPDFWCTKHHGLISTYHVNRFFDISPSGLTRQNRLQSRPYLSKLPGKIATHFINQIVLKNQDQFNIDRILAADHVFNAYYIYLKEIVKLYSTTEGIQWKSPVRLANYHYQKRRTFPNLEEGERVIIFDTVLAGGNLKSELIRYVISQKAIPAAVLVFVYDKGIESQYRSDYLFYDKNTQQYFYKIFNFEVPVYVIDSRNHIDLGFISAAKCKVCNPEKEPEEPSSICNIHAPF